MNLLRSLPRAFNSNVRGLSLAPEEETLLSSQGITDPTVQRYVAWRRATLLMVIIATLLSAGVSTYRTFTEPENQPSVFDTLATHFFKQIDQQVPGASKLFKHGDAAETPAADEQEDEAPSEPRTAFSRFDDALSLFSLYLLPLAALIALFAGNRFRLGYRVMVAAFLLSFFLPMLLALCPWSWWGFPESGAAAGKDPAAFLRDQAEGLQEAAAYLVTLLPSVLSLIPGIQRAGLRIKTLLPESLLPGWLVVIASPLYGLFLLVVFVAIDQAVSNTLILICVALIVGSSLVYAIRANVVTRPLLTEEDHRKMRGVQRLSGLMTALAGIILLGYAGTREVLGIHLVGSDPAKSLMQPIDVVEFVLEIIGRSMFVSALGADFILRANRIAWQQTRSLASSPAAGAYDSAMEGVGAIV